MRDKVLGLDVETHWFVESIYFAKKGVRLYNAYRLI